MKILRAVLSGGIIWALIFALWSVMIFTPGLKDLEALQYAFHYILLIPIVIVGASYYYKSGSKVNGLILGLVMLATGIVLDAIITVPLFTSPQGVGYVKYFLSPLMLVGFAEFVVIAYIYWLKKINSKTNIPDSNN